MAIRRSTQKAQLTEKLAAALPGETFLASVHCETGPSPWLNAIFEEIPFLGLIIALTRKTYFLTLTPSALIVTSANRFTNRPGEIVTTFPRNAIPVSKVKRATVWSRLFLQFPDTTKPTRLNVHRYWRGEFDQLIAAFPAEAVPAGTSA